MLLYYCWSILSTIDVLELRNNELSGTIPPELFTARLRGLNLSRNRLNGTIPSAISNSPRLQAVLLLGNNLSGTIPGDAFGRLTDLELVNVASNALTGSIPTQIGSLPVLEFSSYIDSGLSGNVPESFCAIDTIPRQVIADCSSGDNNSVNLECSCCRRFDLGNAVGGDDGTIVTTCKEDLPDFLLDRLF
jgi:hypothetical protein